MHFTLGDRRPRLACGTGSARLLSKSESESETMESRNLNEVHIHDTFSTRFRTSRFVDVCSRTSASFDERQAVRARVTQARLHCALCAWLERTNNENPMPKAPECTAFPTRRVLLCVSRWIVTAWRRVRLRAHVEGPVHVCKHAPAQPPNAQGSRSICASLCGIPIACRKHRADQAVHACRTSASERSIGVVEITCDLLTRFGMEEADKGALDAHLPKYLRAPTRVGRS